MYNFIHLCNFLTIFLWSRDTCTSVCRPAPPKPVVSPPSTGSYPSDTAWGFVNHVPEHPRFTASPCAGPVGFASL